MSDDASRRSFDHPKRYVAQCILKLWKRVFKEQDLVSKSCSLMSTPVKILLQHHYKSISLL